MRDWEFKRIVEEYATFMRKITADCSEPTTLSGQECEKCFDRIRNDVMFQDKFFDAVDVRSNDIFFSHRTEEVLDIKGRVTLPKVFATIHHG